MKLLAYRFSSFGDVALVVPAIRSILQANQDLEIHFVSRPVFEPLFNDLPRFHYHGVDLDADFGIVRLRKLYKELAVENWDVVLDLHGVLRTWILNSFFRLGGFKVVQIDKGRKDKKKLTRKEQKDFRPLMHATERYLDVFRRAGFEGEWLNEGSIHTTLTEGIEKFDSFIAALPFNNASAWIAVAPFSKHIQKEWPFHKIKELVTHLREKGHNVFLFGAGKTETEKLQQLANDDDGIISVADQLDMHQELALLEHIDVMVSMDSFNMHLASLTGTKVVSIWGATHPFAGFGPGKSNDSFIVQRDDLSCRPCSVFGNKPCYRGDLACLDISVEQVYSTIQKALNK